MNMFEHRSKIVDQALKLPSIGVAAALLVLSGQGKESTLHAEGNISAATPVASDSINKSAAPQSAGSSTKADAQAASVAMKAKLEGLLLEDPETPPVLTSSLAPEVQKELQAKLCLSSKAVVNWHEGDTNTVAVQIFVIKDTLSGSRAFFFDPESARAAVRSHNINYRQGPTENGTVRFIGGKPLLFENKQVLNFRIFDSAQKISADVPNLETAINQVNAANTTYHAVNRTYPVNLQTIIYKENKSGKDAAREESSAF